MVQTNKKKDEKEGRNYQKKNIKYEITFIIF